MNKMQTKRKFYKDRVTVNFCNKDKIDEKWRMRYSTLSDYRWIEYVH